MTVAEAKDRLKQATAEYNTAGDEFESATEEDKTALAWKCFRLHRNYREAFTGVMKAIMAEWCGSLPTHTHSEHAY